jgi:hypothetical protein
MGSYTLRLMLSLLGTVMFPPFLRGPVLDRLFGKEEPFDYHSTTAPSTPPPSSIQD